MEKAHVIGIRIKIVSDGTRRGTKVVDAVTGEKIPNVRAIDWHIDATVGMATCKLELVKVPIELEAADADVTVSDPAESSAS